MSDSDDLPVPEPSGALDPPRRPPPTAVATADASFPEPVSGPVRWPARRGTDLWSMAEGLLDVLDRVGDGVRRALNLR